MTASWISVTTNAAAAASTIFSVSSVVARHEPAHEAREHALLALERQQAGGQQQRHEHQRERRGDATANWSSGVLEPPTTVCLTRTGWPIEDRIGLLRSRFSAARRAKRLTCCSGARCGASCGRPFSDCRSASARCAGRGSARRPRAGTRACRP